MADECASEELDSYSVSAHVGALFIVLACGGLGATLPAISHHVPRLRPQDDVLTFGNFFGAGVVLATALIHMIMPAIENLTNPCLGAAAEVYEALPLLIVLVSILAMQALEFVLALHLRRGAKRVPMGAGDALPAAMATAAAAPAAGSVQERRHHHQHGMDLGDKNARLTVTVLLFEMGVALHSVIIGVSLGVVSGDSFATLLAALVFHQFFEGFALGSAVAQTDPTLCTTVTTIAAFALSAPVGTAIGIGVRSSFNENATATLWLLGVFEAISGGILIYTGLVELITYGLTLNPRFTGKDARACSMAAAFAGMYMGAAAMSIIGKWA
ncbi:Zinc/iron permease [Tribonema minus]|uniref:Zinc/iron permease n=1 Tax=Tribonema minus TaxID=303371 RepID=A0A835Z312_9STRA|nr:Zinc/iron permease [Tribonema minus]